MKKIFSILLSIVCFTSINAQTVTGKLVDHDNQPLPSVQLKLYSSQYTYITASSADGSFTFSNITSVNSEDELPSEYYISNNFPNPFNPTTRINITLPTPDNVRMQVYNILGQEVIELTEKYFSAGLNYFDIKLDGLPNGIYLAKFTIGEKYTSIRKLMLIYGSQHLSTSHIYNFTTNNKLFKTPLATKFDSLVATSTIIGKKKFTNLPLMSGNSLSLGNMIIERYCISMPTVTYAGKTYNTVQIGTQCWLKENLNVGNWIPGNQEQTNNQTIDKYCYNDDENNCTTYGGLYQWAEAVQYKNGASNTTSQNPAFSDNVQGICPTGWHIPTKAEFESLKASANSSSNALKAVGQGTGTGAGTNTSGFSALLAGRRDISSNFTSLGNGALFWNSSGFASGNGYLMILWYDDKNINMDYGAKSYGFSVRCIKD